MLVLSGPARAQAPTADSTARRDSLARFTLAPVDVTVTRTETDLRRVPYAVEAVSMTELGRGRGKLTLDEALAGVPGVLAINRQNYSQDVVLSTRGFGSRTQFGVRGLKVLLDGIPQTLPDGQGQLTNVALDDVDRVEVLRGSASSLYGNASGGVISLWTDQARRARVAPTVRVLVGANGLTKYRGAIDVPVGAASISASGERMVTDGFRSHSRADIRQGRIRVGLPMGRTSMTLIAQLADDPWLEDPGAVTAAELALDSTANPANVTRPAGRPNGVGKEVRQGQLGLTGTRTFLRGGSLTATVFGLKRNLANPIASAFIGLDRWAYGIRTSGTLPFALGPATGTITTGLDGQWLRDARVNENVARTARTRDQLELVNELGPFAQVSFSPVPRATVTLGARYDRVRFEAQDHFLSDGDDSGVRLMDAPSGTAGIVFDVHDAAIPYASVSTSFETPTTTELGNQPTGPGGFNPTLNPQTATNYEVGLRGFIAGRARYSAAFYRAEVRSELIPFDVPGAPGRRFYRNAGSSRHQGAEIGVTVSPISALRIRGGYTYSKHHFLNYRTATLVMDGKALPGVPRHYLSGSATLEVARHGWVTIEETASSSCFVDDPNTLQNGKWAATNVRAGVDVAVTGWNIKVFGGVGNLWNARYAGSVQVNAAGGRYFEPAPPRSFFVGAEIGAR